MQIVCSTSEAAKVDQFLKMVDSGGDEEEDDGEEGNGCFDLEEIIDVMHKRGFEVSELKLFASARSAGKPMETPFGTIDIQEFTLEAARDCDVVFLAVSGDFALEWVPKLTADGGPLVIDNSSAYRCAGGREAATARRGAVGSGSGGGMHA